MRKGMAMLMIAFGLGLWPQPTSGQDISIPADSSRIDTRSPDPSALREAREDPDFLYDREPVVRETLWDFIKRWINKILNPILTSRSMQPVWNALPYILAFITALFVISRLLKTNFRGLFQTSHKPTPAFTLLEADLQNTDFDMLIQAAVRAGRYRDAVRYSYLKALRILTDQNLIDWQRDKTNRMYVHELKDPELKSPFSDLTRQFAFIWYGHRPVEARHYEQIQMAFSRFMDLIQAGRAS